MCSWKVSKRNFLKGLGLLAGLWMLAPFFRKSGEVGFDRDYPMDASKEPNSVAREIDLL